MKLGADLVASWRTWTTTTTWWSSGRGTARRWPRRASHAPGESVCVLERGREILPGDYPDTLAEAGGATQVSTGGGHGSAIRSALFSFHIGDDISVLSGCGLGGTSLINANVSLEADPRVFERGWPQALRDDVDGGLAAGIARARTMLGANPLPDDRRPRRSSPRSAPRPPRSATRSTRTPVNVTFTDTAQRGRGRAARVQRLRRLRVGVQRGREEHAAHELPPRRGASRRAHLHRGRRPPRRPRRATGGP